MKNQFKRKEEPSITQLMIESGKSRERVLEDLGLVQPKRILNKEPRNDRDVIKQAKLESKNSIGESLIKFFNYKTPNWGSIVFNGMRVKTL